MDTMYTKFERRVYEHICKLCIKSLQHTEYYHLDDCPCNRNLTSIRELQSFFNFLDEVRIF
jgi:hypothetical protein